MILYFTINPPHQWVRLDNQGVHDSGVVELLADLPAAERCVLVVPGELVVTRAETFPLRNRKKLLSAIPYAIEDSLVSPVDDLHFSILDIDAANRVTFAYVERALMVDWLAQVQQAGFAPFAIIPDYLLLPPTASQAVVTTDAGGRILVRNGKTGAIINNGIIGSFLQGLDEGVSITVNRALLEQAGELIPENIRSRITTDDIGSGMPDWLSGNTENPDAGLLSGEFRPENGLFSMRKYWPAAAIVALAAVISFGSDVAELVWLKQKHAELGQQIDTVYAGMFPGSQVVPGRVRTQTETKLKKLASLSGGDDFTYLLVTVSGLLQNQQANLEEIDFRNGTLTTVLTLNDFSHMDRVQKTLQGNAGISVNLKQSGAKGNKVQARFEISRSVS